MYTECGGVAVLQIIFYFKLYSPMIFKSKGNFLSREKKKTKKTPKKQQKNQKHKTP
jgi:hypothetical protein